MSDMVGNSEDRSSRIAAHMTGIEADGGVDTANLTNLYINSP